MSAEATTLAQRTSTYRDYPEDLKAAVISAIQANGGNVMATARLFNLPRDTVNYWWRNSERFVEIQRASTITLADKLEDLAHSNVESLSTHDLSIVSYSDKARALGVIIDKMQLLRGEPTSITANIDRQDITVYLQSSLDNLD